MKKSLIPRVVPWATNQEFRQVFDWLYSDVKKRPDLVQRGVDVVKAWVCRGRTPISVKATLDLIELQLREQKQLKPGSIPLSQNELRLLYGASIVRFVNSTADSLQTGYYARSLYDIAGKIGLPLHFVQLRHAVTHEDLPSLFMLRQASVEALQWLYDNYWHKQLEMDYQEEVDDNRTYQISEVINKYKAKKMAVLKSNSGAQDGGQKWLNKLVDLLSEDTLQDTVIDLLLKIDALVPSAKTKQSSYENMTVSEELLQIWVPLLHELDTTFANFATELIYAMVRRLGDPDEYVMDESMVRKESSSSMADLRESEIYRQQGYLLTITSWLRYFSTHCGDKDLVFQQNILDIILGACLRTPNIYTKSVLQATMEKDHSLQQSIGPFMEYINESINSNESTDSTSHSTTNKQKIDITDTVLEQEVNEMTEELQNLQEKLGVHVEPEVDHSAESGWVLHDRSTWAPCPIGCLPNGKIPKLDFMEIDVIILD